MNKTERTWSALRPRGRHRGQRRLNVWRLPASGGQKRPGR